MELSDFFEIIVVSGMPKDEISVGHWEVKPDTTGKMGMFYIEDCRIINIGSEDVGPD